MVVVLCGILFQAQSQTNLKQKKFIANRDTVFLDSLSLIPGSVQLRLKRSTIDTSIYKINYKLKALGRVRRDTVQMHACRMRHVDAVGANFRCNPVLSELALEDVTRSGLRRSASHVRLHGELARQRVRVGWRRERRGLRFQLVLPLRSGSSEANDGRRGRLRGCNGGSRERQRDRDRECGGEFGHCHSDSSSSSIER